jgi:predicted nucleotidyltransferase
MNLTNRQLSVLHKIKNICDFVITGSVSLNLYGAIDRPCSDIDILITHGQFDLLNAKFGSNNDDINYNYINTYANTDTPIRIGLNIDGENICAFVCGDAYIKSYSYKIFNIDGVQFNTVTPLKVLATKIDYLFNINFNIDYANSNPQSITNEQLLILEKNRKKHDSDTKSIKFFLENKK